MTLKFYIWHRRLALFVMLPLLLFGLSGLLHPVMRLTAPAVQNHVYLPPSWPKNIPELAGLAAKIPLQNSAGLRPVKVGEHWYLQHWHARHLTSEFYSFAGDKAPSVAKAYAIQLARHYTGLQNSLVKQVRLVTEFDKSYGPINRLLPVWQVQFDDAKQLSVYVDIRQDRLAGLMDDRRHFFMGLFQIFHTWDFIDQESPVRTVLFISFMLAALVVSLSGLYLYSVLPLSRRKMKSLKKTHATFGVCVSLALLMFVLSGLVRTLEKQTDEVRGVALQQHLNLLNAVWGLKALQQRFSDITSAYPHALGGEIVWQVIQPRKQDIWVHSGTGREIIEGAQQFSHEVLETLGYELTAAQNSRRITHFKADQYYGFIDKRLPVTALDYPDKTYYIDTRAGVLSVKVDSADKAFAWVFRYLHKWRFADGLGLNVRDGSITLFILAICISIGLGLQSWLKGWRNRRLRLAPSSMNKNSDNKTA